MQVGFIGLGKMGMNMVLRLKEQGYEVIAWNRSPEPREEAAKQGIAVATSIDQLMQQMESPHVVWIMVEAGNPVESILFGDGGIAQFAQSGDIIIDGGNSYYKDSVRRASKLADKGIYFMDVGVSGGPEGARKGACLMIGGDQEVFNQLRPLFEALAIKDGYGYFGQNGAGHFVKMIHNGIEYGFMQSLAEGFELLSLSPFKLNLAEVSRVWNHGSILESRLIRHAHEMFQRDGKLEQISGFTEESGEGRWTVMDAIERNVPATAIAHSLFERFRSRQKESFANKVLSGLRREFTGHEVKEKNSSEKKS